MVVDLHAKSQLNICKRLGKKSPENCLIGEIYKVQGLNFVKNEWSMAKPKLDL